jgi:CBS domain-containing protein
MRLRSFRVVPLVGPLERLELLRERTAVASRDSPVDARTRTLFAGSSLRCQRGGRNVSGEECLACRRIVSVRPSPDRRVLTVRCLWIEADPVDDVMTLADHAVKVRATDPVAAAGDRLVQDDVHHALVVDGDDVIGWVCRRDLHGDGRVGDRMHAPVWTVPPATTLGQAITAMGALSVDLLAVTDGAALRGVIAAADLGLDD